MDDDGSNVAGAEQIGHEKPEQDTFDPVWRLAHVHHCDMDNILLNGVQVTACCPLAPLRLGRGSEEMRRRRDARRRVLQEQLALAALEADGQRPLHLRREFTKDVLVVFEAGQVLAMGELSQPPANGAGQCLEPGRGHIDASEALQAEGVPTHQQLRSLKDVVVCAQTDRARSVLQIFVGGLHLLPVALLLSRVRSPGVFTSPPLPLLASVSPSASFHPVKVGTPRPPHVCTPLFLPMLLFTVTLLGGGFGFDIRGVTAFLALASFRRVSLLVLTHVAEIM